MSETRLIALDLDGTLTQHKSKLGQGNRRALDALRKKYALLIVGAGACVRIWEQLDRYPVPIIGNYGMQASVVDGNDLILTEDHVIPIDQQAVRSTIGNLRKRFDLCDCKGDIVQFHASGMVTFPLLGTQAPLSEKLSFDPDRRKRRVLYEDVKSAFPKYSVFIGGSSSFDIVPCPYNKLYAIDRYALKNGFSRQQIIYIGDDYGPGGNDEQVFCSDISFITIDKYEDFPERVGKLI